MATQKEQLTLVFNTDYRLMEVKILLTSIKLSFSIKTLVCLFLSGHLRQVLLYDLDLILKMKNKYFNIAIL